MGPVNDLDRSAKTQLRTDLPSREIRNALPDSTTIWWIFKTNSRKYAAFILTTQRSWFIVDSVVHKVLSLFRREMNGISGNGRSQIRVYRSHAARAISEERWDVAEIFLDRILAVEPQNTEAWLMKGHLSQHCRSDEIGAVNCYRKVITVLGSGSSHPHAQKARLSLDRLLATYG